MRGLIEGLVSPAPLARTLPALLQEDDQLCRFVAGLDELFAPLLVTLDTLDAYLDPALAPSDFLDWLASWVGLGLDHDWPLERRRALVGEAASLFRARGTREALARLVELEVGVRPEIREPGGTTWSTEAGARLPGGGAREIVVTVVVADPATIDLRRLERVVAEATPAHLPHRLEVRSP